MTTDATLDVAGTQPTSTDIPLCAGWNLIGYPLDEAQPVAEALASIEGKYDLVFAYDPTDAADPWEVYEVGKPDWSNDLPAMEPGRGFWVHATEDVTLTIAKAEPTATPTPTPTATATLPPAVGDPPTAEISSPADGSEVTDFVDIVGTADDPDGDLVEYRLQYRQVGTNGTALRAQQKLKAMGLLQEDAEWTTFATGNAPVVNDVLGTLDPTLLLNGMFELRLLAVDSEGQQTTTSVHLVITGEQKVGHFRLTFKDLEIPVAGLDLIVWRTYDSRDKRVGDFGYGWTMGLVDVQVAENGTPGEEWEQTVQDLQYCMQPTQPHIVTVALPGGQVHQFAMGVSPRCQGLRPIRFARVTYTPLPGTTSRLTPLADTNVVVDGFGGPVTLRDLDFNVYDPQGYRLTTRSGNVLVISEQTGLQSIRDHSGNSLTFGAGSITHSTGKGLVFERDGLGRVTRITDPMGYTINYTYDAIGDLVSVTDQEENVTTFIYDDNHYLLEIRDPLGRTAARTEYDEDGRIISVTDADNNRTEFTHDLDNRREIIRDPSGNEYIVEYDAQGNMTAQTDPLGNTTTYTYDDQGNMLTETDPLGNTISYAYDNQGNRLTVTTPLGGQVVNTYNAAGDVLTTRNPLGHTTTMSYDASGNLTAVEDPLGNITTYAYDESGNLTSKTDPLNNTTMFAYNAFGDLTSETDALGNVTTYTYDADGNQLTRTTTRTKADGSVEVMATENVYDRINRLVQTTDPEGNTTEIRYDAAGQMAEWVNGRGAAMGFTYTNRGETGSVEFADGTSESFSYNVNGRLVSTTDRQGRATEFAYDAAGRMTEKTFPTGATFGMGYDAAARITSVEDPLGSTQQVTYNEFGQATAMEDALGNATEYTYDTAGQVTSKTDAIGRVIGHEYDANGQTTRTIYPNGTEVTMAYDAAGRMTSETDQAGRTTNYTYDAVGHLTSVTDALGNVTRYEYDEVGNMISMTDANGNTTTYEYDNLGRRIRRTLPLSMFETWTYDAAGNVTSYTDFNGNTVAFAYDTSNRLVIRTFPDGSTESYTYTASGKVASITDSRGVTTYEYDDADRLIRRTDPDGRAISYTYDATGFLTSVTTPAGTTTYSYDTLGRLETVTDPDGGVSTYTHNDANIVTRITYPNGTVLDVAYDDLNRLTNVEHRTGGGALLASYAYTYDAVGNRIQAVEDTGRQIDYTYDDLNRLIEENIRDPVQGDEVIQYTYDAVGNRLTKTDASGTAMYTYDANDRLRNDGTNTYTYDANGNLLSKDGPTQQVTYEYDLQNRLIGATVTNGGTTTSVAYQYDAEGNRVQTAVNGTDVVNYLVDTVRPFAQVLLETDGAGNTLASYVYGHDLISQKRNGTASYYHYDGTLSTRALSDSAATITDKYDYDAFGLLRNATGTTPNNYRFAGEQFDPKVDLYYLRARYYDPAIGRFLARDPVQGMLSRPATHHPYGYAENNPLTNFDPSGLQTIAELAVVTTLISQMSVLWLIEDRVYAGFVVAKQITWQSAGQWWQWAGSFDATANSASGSAQITRSSCFDRNWIMYHNERVLEIGMTSSLKAALPAAARGLDAVTQFVNLVLTPRLGEREINAGMFGAATSAVLRDVLGTELEVSVTLSTGMTYVINAPEPKLFDGLAIGVFGELDFFFPVFGIAGWKAGVEISKDWGWNTGSKWGPNGLYTTFALVLSAGVGAKKPGIDWDVGYLMYWADRTEGP